MSYQVPINSNDKIFLINRSVIQERFDAQYYKEHFNFDGYVRLNNYVSVQGGKRIPKGMDYCLQETPFLYLRVADIMEDSSVDYMRLRNIDDLVFKVLERYELHNGELVISIAGTIGKVYFAKDIPINKKVILTENCAKLVVNNKDVLPEYLSIILQMPILKRQIELNYIQTTIPKMGLDRIGRLMIPPIPSVEKQREIIEYINEAYAKKQKKENEAQQLIDSIDSYILEELGIILPKIKNDIESRVFLVKRADLEDRLDPKFNKDYSYIRNLTSNYPWATLKDVVLNSGQYGANESAKDYNIGDVRYIRITDIDEFGNLKTTDKKTASNIDKAYTLNYNDVLFARSGSVGRCYIHKDMSEPAIFAGYLIRYFLNKNKIAPDYLFYYCNSKLYNLWVNTIQRPAVQANINAQEFLKLTLPLPPLNKQQEIVNHIMAIRQKAKALQEEGKAILEQAKKEVESMIMYGKKN